MKRTGRISDYLRTLLCSILILSSFFISDVNAKYRPSSHRSHISHSSYPKHSGLSGSSGITHQSYKPTYTYNSHNSHSLSGGSSAHGYPGTNSLSGSRSRPGSASYPPTNGLSGNTASGGHYNSVGSPINSYATSNSHSSSGARAGSVSYPSYGLSGNTASGTRYPTGGSSVPNYPGPASYHSSNGLSGSTASGTRYPSGGSSVHNYPGPASNPSSNGLSGNTASGNRYSSGGSSYPSNAHQSTSWGSNKNVYHHTNSHTVIHHHHHYDYSPPRAIYYRTSYGASAVSYPVYTGIPPTYVYEYRSSGNKYSHLLAGLALYNLGRMSANSNYNQYHTHYQPQPNERCIFGVRYNTGAVEEMTIECKAITYFIYESMQVQPQVQPQTQTHVVNQTTITTQTMFPNGTLMNPVSTQTQIINNNGVVVPNTQQYLGSNGQLVNTQQVNTVTTTTTQVTSVNDPRLSGNPVEVNPNMNCYVKRTTLVSHLEKPVPCDLLHEYADSSLRRNSGVMVKSCLTGVLIGVAFLLY